MIDGLGVMEAATKNSVLVVDDEPQVLRAIEDTLEDSFRVYVESSPEVAIELLRELPDLSVIVSDQRMPGLNGDEFLARARELSNATRLMITGYADLEAVTRAVNMGKIFGYISKPWNPEHLKLTVFKAAEHFHLLSDLATERELLHQLMDNSPDAIFFKDLEHRFIRINKANAARMGAKRPEDALGRTVRDFLPAELANQIEPEDREVLRSGAALTGCLSHSKHLDGEERWYSTNRAPIRNNQGRIVGLVGIARDVTEQRRAEEQIKCYLKQLETAFMHTVEMAMTLSEMRDPYIVGHERRVAEIAVAIGTELEFDSRRSEGLRVAGYLHDIGKIHVPAEILAKPGKLSPIEMQLIMQHAQASYDILKNVEFPWPVAEIARQHHERLDGSGYPRGLKGDAILLEARILAVADTIEAMSSHRPYRPGLGINKAVAEIERGRGTVYDPEVANACIRLFREKGYAIPAYPTKEGPPALPGNIYS